MKVKRPNLTLFKKILMVDLIKGLLLTFSYQRPSANYTEQYPKARPTVAERLRGDPRRATARKRNHPIVRTHASRLRKDPSIGRSRPIGIANREPQASC